MVVMTVTIGCGLPFPHVYSCQWVQCVSNGFGRQDDGKKYI